MYKKDTSVKKREGWNVIYTSASPGISYMYVCMYVCAHNITGASAAAKTHHLEHFCKLKFQCTEGSTDR